MDSNTITITLINIYTNINYINFLQKQEKEKNIRNKIDTLIKYIENKVDPENYKKEYIDIMSFIKKLINELPYLNYNVTNQYIIDYKNLIETIIYIIEKIDTSIRKLPITKEIVKTIKEKCSNILENQNKIEFYSYINNYYFSYNYSFLSQNTQNNEELKVKIKKLLNKDIEVFLDLIIQALSQNQQEILLHEIKISPLLNEIKDLLYKLNSYVSNEEETKLIENHN